MNERAGKTGAGSAKVSEGAARETWWNWIVKSAPAVAFIGAFAVPIILILTCYQGSLDDLRKGVAEGDKAILEDIKEVGGEVHENKTNIAVLKNEMETVTTSIGSMDQKLDILLRDSVTMQPAAKTATRVVEPVLVHD